MVNWTSEADAKLLVAILKTAKPKIDHEVVAQFMDMNVTGYAVQHRLRKLNALAKGASSAPTTPAKSTGKAENGSDMTPTPSPRKRVTGNVNRAKPASPGRKRRNALVKGDSDDEETMAKKAKKGVEDCA